MWTYTIIPKRFPHLKTMAIFSFRIPKEIRAASHAKLHFFYENKTCTFFGRRKLHNTYCCIPWFFSLNTSQKYEHTYMTCADWEKDRKRRHWPTHHVHIHVQLVHFSAPSTVTLCERRNMIKEAQVFCRNTSDPLCQVLVTGTSKWPQILWGMEQGIQTNQWNKWTNGWKNNGCF